MSSFSLAVCALLGALLAQSYATALAVELFLRRERGSLARRSWLALAIASLLFALQHGYALELAVSTGLHDLRQALLAGCASLLLALALHGLRASEAIVASAPSARRTERSDETYQGDRREAITAQRCNRSAQ
jgi:membrane protease YdiL (CAAX protease family)